MSTNCLVTKLKGSVDNNNLPIYNSVKFYIGNVSSKITFAAVPNKTIKVRTLDGSEKIATSEENRDSDIFVSSVTIGSSRVALYFKQPNCTFVIEGKDRLYQIGYSNDSANMLIDLSELNHATNLGRLHIQYSTVYGTFENLYDTNIKANIGFNVENSTFKDDTDFNKLGNIRGMESNCDFSQYIRGTNLKGSIEGFVANLRKTHDYTSGSVKFNNMFTGQQAVITFNGSKIAAASGGSTWSWVANEQDSTMTDITSPNDITITIDADGNKVE
jgi:hypothetical protein